MKFILAMLFLITQVMFSQVTRVQGEMPDSTFGFVQLDSSGNQLISGSVEATITPTDTMTVKEIVDALPAGTNAIGKLAANSGVDIGDVTTTNPVFSQYTEPDSFFVATAGDTLTTTWTDIGVEIDMRGYTQLNIFITLDINSGTNARIRALGLYETGGTDEYPFMIETVSSSDIKVDAEYTEFNTDADQLAILRVETNGVPFIVLQGYGSLGGGSQYDKIYINKIWR